MYATVNYTGNGVTTDFAVPFPFLSQSHVEVSVNSVSVPTVFVGSVIRISPAPAVSATISIQRNTSRATRIVDFQVDSNITEKDLDNDSKQAFYMAQEAIDRTVGGAVFTVDAHGDRVINVADPINDQDAATKKWVMDYVSGAGLGGPGVGGGLDIRPLNNVGAVAFTGNNEFQGTVNIKSAQFSGTRTATLGLLDLDKALCVSHNADYAVAAGFGANIGVRRTTGTGYTSGVQVTAIGSASWSGLLNGMTAGAYRAQASTGNTYGAKLAIVFTNAGDSTSERYGLDVRYMNRDEGVTSGGQSAVIGQAGSGTGSNYYNVGATAFRISSQERADAGATYTGWSRAMRFMPDSMDLSNAAPYDGGRSYIPGDYVSFGGLIWMAQRNMVGTAPNIAITTDWSRQANIGGLVGAIGIDFGGVGQTTADRMLGAIRLRGDMPILWDTEGVVGTAYRPTDGVWHIRNTNVEIMGVNVLTKDIRVAGIPRVLGTPAQFSAHRNFALLAIAASTYTNVSCASEEYDDRNEYVSGRHTPTIAGTYCYKGAVQADIPPVGYRLYTVLAKNGAVVKSAVAISGASVPSGAPICADIKMNGTTDYVELWVFWTGPGGITISGEPSATYFQGSKNT